MVTRKGETPWLGHRWSTMKHEAVVYVSTFLIKPRWTGGTILIVVFVKNRRCVGQPPQGLVDAHRAFHFYISNRAERRFDQFPYQVNLRSLKGSQQQTEIMGEDFSVRPFSPVSSSHGLSFREFNRWATNQSSESNSRITLNFSSGVRASKRRLAAIVCRNQPQNHTYSATA